MTAVLHDPFIVEDAFAVLGFLCLLCSLFVIGLIAWASRCDARAEQRRNRDRADWSAGRRVL